MPSSTARYAIPYPVNGDPVANTATNVKALADFVDLLMGECGNLTISAPTPGTPAALVVNFARSYASLPSILGSTVVFTHIQSIPSTTTIHLWLSAITTTSFTVNIVSNVAVASRQITWRFLPRG